MSSSDLNTTQLCNLHKLPKNYICLFKDCKNNSIFCNSCILKDHQCHTNIYKIGEFIKYFNDVINYQKKELERDNIIINISAIIQHQKYEIETQQLQILQKIMKRLSNEKKKIFEILQQIQKINKNNQQEYKIILENRYELLKYLNIFINKKQFMQFKLLSSSNSGIALLRNKLFHLQNLNFVYGNRNIQQITKKIAKQAQNVCKNSYLNRLKQQFCGSRNQSKQIFKKSDKDLSKMLNFRVRMNSETSSKRTEKKNRSMDALPLVPRSPETPRKKGIQIHQI